MCVCAIGRDGDAIFVHSKTLEKEGNAYKRERERERERENERPRERDKMRGSTERDGDGMFSHSKQH